MKIELDMDIKEAVIKMHQMEIDMLPSNDKLSKSYQLSASFFNDMEQLVKRVRRKEQQGLALRWFAAAVAVVFLLVFATHPQYIATARNHIMKWYEDHIQFNFKDDMKLNHIPEYELGYVPEGYELVENNYSGATGLIDYENGEKHLYFTYGLSDGTINVNNERVEFLILKTENGNTIYYLKSINEEESIMIWLSEDETIAYTLIGIFSQEELLKILENIVEK